MKTLNIDIETRSDIDIKYGVYKYVDSPKFKILLFAYSIDHGPVEIIDLENGESFPGILWKALEDQTVKIAFNASFERTCLAKHFNQDMPPEQWRDTMVHGMELGLPASLEQMAKFLKLDQQKDTEGKRLIRKFCVPKKDGTFNKCEGDDWELFKEYCRQDVRTEMDIADTLSKYPIAESEWDMWALDQRINDRGVGVDLDLVNAAIRLNGEDTAEGKERLRKLTGLENPSSVMQLKNWLAKHGLTMPTLGAEAVRDAIARKDINPEAKQALELRQRLSGSAVKKYDMLANATTSGGHIHGILQFYGASRTGRWAGRLLQVQNLPRGSLKPSDLDNARYFVKQDDADALEMVYGEVPEVLKSLIRTTLIPSPDHKLIVSDFSAIEARVIAWLAGEEWVLDTFRNGHDIYKATANQMFNLGGVDKVDKSMRQRGKVATLALGYQGGVGALKAMGAIKMGINENELQGLVTAWRKANPRIVKLWSNVESAATTALEYGAPARVPGTAIKFYPEGSFLFAELPSGRRIAYAMARLEGGRIKYEGKDQTKATFTTLDTYGGKLTENLVQATARDVLGEAMLRLEELGFKIVAHVHDEAIIDVPNGTTTVEDINEIMSINPKWTEGLPLAAAGFESEFYMKD